MVYYKLTYFDARGLAEISRLICHLGKIPYEDVRIPRDEWPERKKDFPFEQVPVLEIDGVEIPQSVAIARFLARKAGLAGKSDVEEAVVDALADQFKDFYWEAKPYYLAAMNIFPESAEKLAELQKAFLPVKERFLRFLTHYLKKSKSGFLAGGDLTFVDLIVAENILTYRTIGAHVDKVTAIPDVKSYLAARPIRDF